jgi:hypothetical protein
VASAQSSAHHARCEQDLVRVGLKRVDALALPAGFIERERQPALADMFFDLLLGTLELARVVQREIAIAITASIESRISAIKMPPAF